MSFVRVSALLVCAVRSCELGTFACASTPNGTCCLYNNVFMNEEIIIVLISASHDESSMRLAMRNFETLRNFATCVRAGADHVRRSAGIVAYLK